MSSISEDIFNLYWSDDSDPAAGNAKQGLRHRTGSYLVSKEWLWETYLEARKFEALKARFTAANTAASAGNHGTAGSATASSALVAPTPTLALWGLSQGGKSTALQSALDLAAPLPSVAGTTAGFVSLLQWDAAQPVIFSHRAAGTGKPSTGKTDNSGKTQTASAPISLNTYNAGSKDATACKTRFVLRETLPAATDTLHPAQVRLLDNQALLKTLAVGYINNLQLVATNDDDPRLAPLQEDEILDALTAGTTKPVDGVSKSVDGAAFRKLVDFVAVLKAAKETSDTRYAGIREKIYRQIIALDVVTTDLDAAIRKIFWTNDPRLTAIYESGSRLIASLAGKQIFADYAVVKLLLNMQTHANATGDDATLATETTNAISALRKETAGNIVKIHALTTSTTTGTADFATADALATLQAVVSEIILPVNKTTLRAVEADSPIVRIFGQLLAKADILDMPGITWRPPGNELNTPIDKDVYSSVVKLGKTLSISSDTAQDTIDDMAVFISLEKHGFTSRSHKLLRRGVERWTDERKVARTSAIFTKADWYFRDLVTAGNAAPMRHFTNFSDFGRVTDREKANLKIAHYSFEGEQLLAGNTEQLETAARFISQNAGAFEQQFGANFGIEKIIQREDGKPDGKFVEVDGRRDVIEFLAESATLANAAENIRAAFNEKRERLRTLLSQHAPRRDTGGTDAEKQRAIALAKIVEEAIDAKLNSIQDEDAARKFGDDILQFANVHDALPEFPPNFFAQFAFWPYAERVIPEIKRKKIEEFAGAGDKFRAIFNLTTNERFTQGDAHFFVEVLIELIANKKVTLKLLNGRTLTRPKFFHEFEKNRWKPAQGALQGVGATKNVIRENLRRSLEILLESELLGRSKERIPPPERVISNGEEDLPLDVEVEVEEVADDDVISSIFIIEHTPHYPLIIQFKERLKKISDINISNRPVQGGDARLEEIILTI